MPKIEELMDIVGQTISERKMGMFFHNDGIFVCVRSTTTECRHQQTL